MLIKGNSAYAQAYYEALEITSFGTENGIWRLSLSAYADANWIVDGRIYWVVRYQH